MGFFYMKLYTRIRGALLIFLVINLGGLPLATQAGVAKDLFLGAIAGGIGAAFYVKKETPVLLAPLIPNLGLACASWLTEDFHISYPGIMLITATLAGALSTGYLQELEISAKEAEKAQEKKNSNFFSALANSFAALKEPLKPFKPVFSTVCYGTGATVSSIVLYSLWW